MFSHHYTGQIQVSVCGGLGEWGAFVDEAW